MRKPEWDIDKLAGEEAEELTRRLRTSLLSNEVEVKYDRQTDKTGNVFVEYECLRNGRYEPSGIATTKARATAFVVCDRSAIVVVETGLLLHAVRGMYRMNPASRRQCRDGSHPTKGVIMPLRELTELCFAKRARAAIQLSQPQEATSGVL